MTDITNKNDHLNLSAQTNTNSRNINMDYKSILMNNIKSEDLIYNHKATMELNMMLFGNTMTEDNEISVNGIKLNSVNKLVSQGSEIDEVYEELKIERSIWGDEDDSELIEDSDNIENIIIEDVLDNKKQKIYECKVCNLYQGFTDLEFFNHCNSNYHLDNVYEKKKNKQNLTCILMKSDNLYNDDVEQEYNIWKKKEKTHNDNKIIKCSYCKQLNINSYDNHTYSMCPYNKSNINIDNYEKKYDTQYNQPKYQKVII